MRAATGAAAVAAGVLAVPGLAGAAPQPPTVTGMVSGYAVVSTCGPLAGMTLSWTTTAGTVTALALASIPAACIGGSVSVTLVDATNAALGSAGPVTLTGTSQSLPAVTGSPNAASVARAFVSVAGP